MFNWWLVCGAPERMKNTALAVLHQAHKSCEAESKQQEKDRVNSEFNQKDSLLVTNIF